MPEEHSELEIAASGILQVEALSPIDNYTAFAKEGTYTYDAETKTIVAQIEFTSRETAYGASRQGSFNLIAALKDENSNVIVSGVIPFELIDTGYDGVVEPPKSFRDEIADALQKTLDAEASAEAWLNESVENIQNETNTAISSINAAKTEKVAEAETEITEAKTAALGEVENAGANAVNEVNAAKADAKTEIAADLANAKNEIDTWSDQGERFAKNEADISALAIDKLNRGYLQFNKAKLTTATNNATTLPLTLCLTYDCDDWSSCVGKSFGSGVAFFNTEIVNWSNGMHYGFNFGIYSASGNANEIHLAVRTANNVANSVANNYISFNKATGKHTLCVSLSEVADFAVRFYQDGAFLGVRTNKSSAMNDEIGKIYIRLVPDAPRKEVKAEMSKGMNQYLPQNEPFEFISLYEEQTGLGTISVMWLFVVCSSICLVITVLGVYGAISIDTIRKQKEVAIRKINGARLPDIYWLFAKNYLILFLIASVVGGLISLFVMVIGSQHRAILFDYADPWLWMGPLMLLIGIITATISWQIYYIARTNPAEVIKNE